MAAKRKLAPLRPLPFTGGDMQFIRYRMQLSVADFQWLFGINSGHWSEFSNAPHEMVGDPAAAILGRFLNEHPEANLVPPLPDIAEIYAFFNLATPISLKEFGLAFGRHMSAGHRWVSAGKEAPTIIHRILMILSRYITQKMGREIDDCVSNGVNETERRTILGIWNEWRKIVDTEANSRGVKNIWAQACWPGIHRHIHSKISNVDASSIDDEPPGPDVGS